MSDYVKIFVENEAEIVKIFVQNQPPYVRVVTENIIERIVEGEIVFNEEPTGVIDGSNATFTTALPFLPGKISVFINGLLQKIITHYQTIGNNTIQFADSPQPGDQIILNYINT